MADEYMLTSNNKSRVVYMKWVSNKDTDSCVCVCVCARFNLLPCARLITSRFWLASGLDMWRQHITCFIWTN